MVDRSTPRLALGFPGHSALSPGVNRIELPIEGAIQR